MTAGGAAWRWAPLLAAIAVAVAWRGGYTDDARGVVAALAGLAVLAAVAAAPEAAGRAARHPIVLTLAALAVVTALTAAWTTGAPSDAARDAAAILALCAVVVAAALVPAPRAHAGVLLVAAVGSAISGLRGDHRHLRAARARPLRQLAPVGALRVPAGARPRLRGRAARRAVRRDRAPPRARRARSAGGVAVGHHGGADRQPHRDRPVRAGRDRLRCAGAARAPGRPGGAGRDPRRRGQRGHPARRPRPRRRRRPPPGAAAGGRRRGRGARAGGVQRSGGRASWTAAVGVAALLATAAVVLGDRGSPCGADPSHGRVGLWRAALHTATERPVQGFGAGTFLAATRERQLEERPVPTRFAHDLALQEWVELGVAGLLAVLAWYVAVATTLVCEIARPRPNPAAWLLAPAVAAFPLANLLDWPWALTGTGALWALAVGGLLASREPLALTSDR